MARATVFLAIIALCFAVSVNAECKTDADCPSSYCANDPTKTPPYECHACGDFCCLTDADCEKKCTAGAYCQRYPGKHYPYFCHATACNITSTDVPEVAPVVEPEVEAQGGFRCDMCKKLLPYVGDHECASKCSGWWPFLRGACTDVCDTLIKYLPASDTCAAAGYC